MTVFVIELTLKIFGVGLVKFWRENVFNKVDFIAIVGAVFAEILFVAVLHNQRSAILQGFIFMRMLRLLRTLRLVRQFKVRQHSTQLFVACEVVSPWCATALTRRLHPGTHSLSRAPVGLQVMVTSFVDIVPALLRYMGLALGVYYSFAIVGMELFSGKFIRGKLVGTAYFNNDYWLNNFDNLHTAMVTLFELMVVNNWPINMEAAVAATTVWARFYYLAWYAVSVIVVINVLVAFLLDSFATRQALNESEQTGLEKVWKRLFRRSARRLGYSPERWAITREERVGDLYEAMYHNDLKVLHCHSGRMLVSCRGAGGVETRALLTHKRTCGVCAHCRRTRCLKSLAKSHSSLRRDGEVPPSGPTPPSTGAAHANTTAMPRATRKTSPPRTHPPPPPAVTLKHRW